MPIPENPFPHAGMLSHEQRLGLFSVSYSMREEFLIVEINGVPRFRWAYIHISKAAGFLFHHHQHNSPLALQDCDARQYLEHSLQLPIPYAPISQKEKQVRNT
jgi:hypothetical protein